MDGTLVDTHLAVRKAYEAVGVEMPDDAWGRPWIEWLKDGDAHRQKNLIYPKMLRKYARSLPLLDYAVRHKSPVITGASATAAVAVMNQFKIDVVLVGANAERKKNYLSHRPPGIYVDDHEATRRLIHETTQWETFSPQEAIERLVNV